MPVLPGAGEVTQPAQPMDEGLMRKKEKLWLQRASLKQGPYSFDSMLKPSRIVTTSGAIACANITGGAAGATLTGVVGGAAVIGLVTGKP